MNTNDRPVTAGFTLPPIIGKGERNKTLYRYACSLQAKSLSDDDIRTEVLRANEAHCSPPLQLSEVNRVIENALKFEKGLSPEYQKKADAQTAECAGWYNGSRFDFSPLLYPGGIARGGELANLFADYVRDKVRWIPDKKCWYAYDGIRWRGEGKGKAIAENALLDFILEAKAYAIARSMNNEEWNRVGKDLYRYGDPPARRNLLEDSKRRLSTDPTEFDANPNLFNCRNCTLELKPTIVRREHRASDLITKVAGCDYDENTGYGEWLEFLDETFEGCADQIPFLQRSMGLALAGDTSPERFYIFIGTTRTGKSTTVSAIKNVLGKAENGGYAISGQAETFTAQKRSAQNASPDVAMYYGARFADIPELSSAHTFDVERLKQITGGDDITARFLHGNPFTFKPSCTCVITANSFPKIPNDDTLFTSNRIAPITFHNRVPEEVRASKRGRTLKERMKEPRYLSGVLNWMLAGLEQDSVFEPLPLPTSSALVLAKYTHSQDRIGLFIEECCDTGEGKYYALKPLYQAYSQWCKECGERALGRTSFKGELQKRGYGFKDRVKKNGKHLRSVFLGIAPNDCCLEVDEESKE